jgi:hypothetical protein
MRGREMIDVEQNREIMPAENGGIAAKRSETNEFTEKEECKQKKK